MVGGLAVGAARRIGDRYELEAPIGKGGIGEVWRARHVALNSRVAIKFLQLASAEKESAKRRFTTEAQITAQLKTPNAVQVFDFGITEEGQPYLVMELLEGETLGRRLERVGRLGILETAALLGQAARALQRAHQLGIVHRDFKPDNIVICADDEGHDQVKVLDFGIAKLVGALEAGEDRESAAGPREVGDAPSFTQTGMVLGTPLYMAPEQVRNAAEVDLRADIWAFGVVAFQCLTGKAPFTGTTLLELFERIQGGLHPRADFVEPTVPPAFDMWFDIACAPDPSKRFPLASVAFKHLTVALDVMRDTSGSSGSFPGVLDSHASSGERRVVVVSRSKPPDASAATMNAEGTHSGEVRSRTHNDEFASLQRIPIASIDLKPPGVPSTEPPATATPPAPSARRTPWVPLFGVLFVVGLVAAGAAVWGAAGRTVRSDAPPAAVTVPAETPVNAPIATTAAEPVPATPTSASSAATAVAPQPAASAHRAALRLSPRPVVAAATLSAGPPPPSHPAEPPPAAARPPVDPGSYR